MKLADSSFMFSQRRHFFLPHTVQLCDPLLLIIGEPAVFPGAKPHNTNSWKWMDKVTAEEKSHQSKYYCGQEEHTLTQQTGTSRDGE